MDIYTWRDCLWDYIKDNFFSACNPLYLSFHEQILESIYISEVGESEDIKESVIKLFNDECNRYLVYKMNRVSLEREVWSKNERGLSLAICYAVQQILVAEDMSSQSFYEPYIKSLNANHVIPVTSRHENPLGSDFELIWETIRAEICLFFDCNSDKITFKQGLGSNKLRNFPFSQSLLSTSDLNNLVRRWPDSMHISLDSCNEFILRHEGCLSNRSVKKLSNFNYLECISEQLYLYLKNNNQVFDEINNAPIENRSQLEIICITGSFSADIYKLKILNPHNERTLVKSSSEIESFFLINDFVVFLSDFAGKWLSSKVSTKKIRGFRSIIICIKEGSKPNLIHDVSELLGTEPFIIELLNNDTGNDQIIFYEFPLYELKVDDLSLEQLFSKSLIEFKSDIFEFEGGLLVNKIKHRYHLSYPPVNLKYNGVDLKSNEKLMVDGVNVTVKEFFNKIFSLTKESNFHIYFNGINKTIGFESHKINLVLDNPDWKIVDNIICFSKDMLIDSNGGVYFSHFNTYNYSCDNHLILNGHHLLTYSHIPFSDWVDLPKDELLVRQIIESLRKSEVHCWLNDFIFKVEFSKKIPRPFLIEYEICFD